MRAKRCEGNSPVHRGVKLTPMVPKTHWSKRQKAALMEPLSGRIEDWSKRHGESKSSIHEQAWEANLQLSPMFSPYGVSFIGLLE